MPDYTPKKWVTHSVDETLRDELARSLSASRILAQILIQRGIDTPEAGRRFLRPELDQLHEPDALPDIGRAARRLADAAREGERIVIYGDYDVDGVTATALLVQCLRLVGAHADFYIPNRMEEGYGLNADALRQLKEDGAQVVVTVDCGVSAVEEAAAAKELGLTLIITDHHEPGAERPDAFAVIDPKLPDSRYPFKELSGVGVAFKLAWAIGSAFTGGRRVSEEFREFLVRSLALVALGTVADVAPLTDENRVLTHFGLRCLEQTKNPGLRALLEVAGLREGRLKPSDIGFSLGPRLNANGRIADANKVVRLLLSDSYGDALRLAEEIDKRNSERQKIGQKILEEAVQMLGENPSEKVIVLAKKEWHVGVIGAVASRIVEKYHRPTILFGPDSDLKRWKGSARSIPGFNMYRALEASKDFLKSFGGHEMAAGMTIEVELRAEGTVTIKPESEEGNALATEAEAAMAESISTFRAAIQKHADETLTDDDLTPRLNVDAETSLAAVTEPFVAELERLKPFGRGNPKPVLAAYGVRIAGKPRYLGARGQHARFLVRQGEEPAKPAIAFGMGCLADVLEQKGRRFDIAFTPEFDEWRGERRLQLVIKDIHFRDA